MPISVTCSCGARLEIDEKFLGKEVPCPDCHKPLPTKAPPTPPPLDLPDYRRTSGLAVLSLTLALVGAFTILGTLAAIVVGVFALKEIANKSGKLEGLGYARAGIAVGAVFTFITLAAFASPYVFGVDAILRYVALSPRVKYPDINDIESPQGNRDTVVLTRQSILWSAYQTPANLSQNVKADDLILVNIAEDAYIASQSIVLDGDENEDDKLKKILTRLYESELVNLVGRLNNEPLGREGTVVDNKLTAGDSKREILLDLRLGVDRRILIQFSATEKNQLPVMVGIARRNRFERMTDEFRKTFDSRKTK